MKKLIAMILLLCTVFGAAAADDFGRNYEAFQDSYAQNISFINDNTGRHLLPHSFTSTFDAEGQRIYVIASGALYAQISLDDMASQIASCQITLQAPEGMTQGDNRYTDFTVAGYHSYALLMAMHTAASAAERYQLVETVNNGLAAGNGVYESQVGDYRLTCRKEGNTATMLFENELLMVKSIEMMEEDMPTVEITGGDE